MLLIQQSYLTITNLFFSLHTFVMLLWTDSLIPYSLTCYFRFSGTRNESMIRDLCLEINFTLLKFNYISWMLMS